MKNVLLVGRQLQQVPVSDKLSQMKVKLFVAQNLEEVKQVFAGNNNDIDIIIMGAGIELEKRLEIVRFAFETSTMVSVHMKDWASGPEGFLPFVERVLDAFLK